MPRFCVPNCIETVGHQFPRDEKHKILWLKAIRRVKFEPKSGASVINISMKVTMKSLVNTVLIKNDNFQFDSIVKTYFLLLLRTQTYLHHITCTRKCESDLINFKKKHTTHNTQTNKRLMFPWNVKPASTLREERMRTRNYRKSLIQENNSTT